MTDMLHRRIGLGKQSLARCSAMLHRLTEDGLDSGAMNHLMVVLDLLRSKAVKLFAALGKHGLKAADCLIRLKHALFEWSIAAQLRLFKQWSLNGLLAN